MPIYEFSCKDCDRRTEVRATIAEKQAGLAPACPTCGSPRMRRLLSAFATRGTGVSPAAAGAPQGGGCCGGGCCAP